VARAPIRSDTFGNRACFRWNWEVRHQCKHPNPLYQSKRSVGNTYVPNIRFTPEQKKRKSNIDIDMIAETKSTETVAFKLRQFFKAMHDTFDIQGGHINNKAYK
jgi:hypothetical protein